MTEFFKKIRSKNPALVGFFAFFIRIFLWFWFLQLLSRAIFVLHRSPDIMAGIRIWFESSFHGFHLEMAWIAYCMILALFWLLLSSIFKSVGFFRSWRWVFLIITASTCVISFADAELYHAWGVKFNSQAMEFLKHPTEAMASTSEAKWGIVISASAILSILLYWGVSNMLNKHVGIIAHGWRTALWSMFGILLIGPWVRGGLQTIPINQSSAYYSNIPLKNAAAVNSSWNFLYYWVDQGSSIPSEALQFNLDASNPQFANFFGPQTDSIPAMSTVEKPNVVLFLLESFSSHTSAFFSHDYNCTPFLDSLAQTGLAFTHAYAQGDRTAKGMAAVFSGWPGQANQTKSLLTLPTKAAHLPGLGNEAHQEGYHSMFFYGGDVSFDNMKAYLLSTGFHSITSDENFLQSQKGSKWGAHDGFVFQRAIDSMSASDQPFFSGILSLSSHEPFEIPGQTNRGDETQKFLKSIQYTDACIRDFIHRASQQAWFQNTVFVFVADHGRKMGLPNMETYQPKFFQIPIVFWGPALKPQYRKMVESRICSQTDIPATITESLFGHENKSFLFSRNLLKPQPSMSFYQFWDGFGMVSETGHVIWNNPNKQVTESEGTFLDILQIGQSIQWQAAKIFEKL